jgi:hypothetical protein
MVILIILLYVCTYAKILLYVCMSRLYYMYAKILL